MDVEVTFTAVKDNQSVCIRTREQMESCNMEKIQAMKDVVAAFVPAGQQNQIEVRCSPIALPSAPTPPVNPKNQKSDSLKKITSSQLDFLRKLLRSHKIDVQRFCQENGINRIEDLSLDNARTIIADLKQS